MRAIVEKRFNTSSDGICIPLHSLIFPPRSSSWPPAPAEVSLSARASTFPERRIKQSVAVLEQAMSHIHPVGKISYHGIQASLFLR